MKLIGGGDEYRKLAKYFDSIGIQYQVICPHAHKKIGSVERRYRHIVKIRLTLMANAHISSRFWHYAFESSIYLINKMPSLVL